MADSFTPNLNLRKPEVGAAFDTWGGVTGLNQDMDLLDAVFLATGLGTSVGLHVGTGKVLNVEGQLQVADSTDTTKRCTFSADQVATATTINLAIPPAGGTIATKEILVATVQAAHPRGTILSGYYGPTPPSGFIFLFGTIGDATSLATNRANDDCQQLFLHLWGITSNTQCPVTPGGRGASAAADWAAHKQLALPPHAGRGMSGRDNLSGTAAGIITGLTALGQVIGAQTSATGSFSMTAVNNFNFGNVGFVYQAASAVVNNNTVGGLQFGGGGVATQSGDAVRIDNVVGYTPINGNFNVGVSGASGAFNIVQPSIAVDVIIAL